MAARPILLCRIGAQAYACFIEDVVEVAVMVALTPTPQGPPALLGLANRHGAVLPIVDMRVLCACAAHPIDSNTLFIVARSEGQTLGLVVDEVVGVRYLPADTLRDAPSSVPFVRQFASDGEQVIQLLDIAALYQQWAQA